MFKARIVYNRVLMGCMCELAHFEEIEFKSKSAMMKHVRAKKKEIASECHYRYPRDVVEYRIEIIG